MAVYLYRWRYTSTIIYSSVQQFHMTSRYFTFQILATSARNRVYLALFNTEDHTQRGWKYLLFCPVNILIMLYIHSQSRRFKVSRESVQVSVDFAEPTVTVVSSPPLIEPEPASYQKFLILCKSDSNA